MKRTAAVVIALALVMAACGGDDDDTSATATTSTTKKPVGSSTTETSAAAQSLVPVADIPLKLTQIGTFDQPVDIAFTTAPDGGSKWTYIAEKGGRVVGLEKDGAGDDEVLVDVTSEVSNANEQGLLGIAFSPHEPEETVTLYTYLTDVDGNSRLDAYEIGNDIGPAKTIFTADQPYANHNGGGLLFGPDGKLYLGLGDGGAGGDPHGNGQNPDAVLGKILRFDPAKPENPEKYTIGMRNPWRFSFDRENGDLWIGDVGQDAWEEIDRVPAGTPAGVNLGWNLMEGTHTFEGEASDADLLAPVYDYGHDNGQSVVGGYVYRGKKIPQLQGTYLFADTYAGPIRTLREDSGKYVEEDTSLDVKHPVSFAEDLDGELYVVSLDGGIYRIDPA